jgi:hypothetical protein
MRRDRLRFIYRGSPPWRLPVVATTTVGALWVAYRILTTSAIPGAYYRHAVGGEPASSFSYPVVPVTFYLLVVALEVVGLDYWFRRRSGRPLWHKSLVAGAALAPLSVWEAVSLMHSPPYSGYHAVWIVLLNIFLIVLGTASGAAAAALSVRSRLARRRSR